MSSKNHRFTLMHLLGLALFPCGLALAQSTPGGSNSGTPGETPGVQQPRQLETLSNAYLDVLRAANSQAQGIYALDFFNTVGSSESGATMAPADDSLRSQLGIPAGEGLVVTAVTPDSPAARVGLQPNDILLTLNGQPLANSDDLAKLLKAAGEKAVPLRILRGGKSLSLQVKPSYRVSMAVVESDQRDFFIGVQASPLDETLRSHLNLPVDQGLLATDVIKDSPASKAGFEKNDILLELNGTPLSNVEVLVAQVQAAGGSPAKVKILRGGKPKVISVTPERRKSDVDARAAWENVIASSVYANPGKVLYRPFTTNTAGNVAFWPMDQQSGQWVEKQTQPMLWSTKGNERIEKKLDDLSARIKRLQDSIDELKSRSDSSPRK